MVGGWPTTQRHANVRAYGMTTASTTLVSLTAGTANVLGTYATIINPTVGDINGLFLHVASYPSSGTQASVTLAVGTSGANPVLTDMMLGGSAISNQQFVAYLPLAIPSGSILSAALRSPTAATVVRAAVTAVDDGMMGGLSGQAIDTIGFVSASTQGTSVDPGGTANTKPSPYTQLVASTAADYCAIMFAFDSQAKATGTSNQQFVDIGLGASSSETAIIPNWPIYVFGGTTIQPSLTPWFEMDIKAGQRLSVRSQSNIITTPQRTIGITAYGLRA